MTHPGMRVSDEDRQRVVDDLQRHAGAGRLTLDEFSERAGRAWAAVTRADLVAVTDDLPALPPPTRESTGVSRSLLVAIAAAVVFIVILGVVRALFRP